MKKIFILTGEPSGDKLASKVISKLKNQGVIVKFPKKKQDLRIDLPTIGLETFIQSKKAGLKGIVVKNRQHVFLNRKKCVQFANKNKMFISVK